MNSSDEQDDLWNLLGKARQPQVSPFFARNVVREIRTTQRERAGFLGLISRHWRASLVGAAVSCVAAVAAFQFVGSASQNHQIDSLLAITEQISESPDFNVINDLDDLIASEESSIWLESSVH